MSKEFEFFIYLLERYAVYKGIPANAVLKIWNEKKVHNQEKLSDFILSMYWLYHTERIENAFMDIDHLIETGMPLE